VNVEASLTVRLVFCQMLGLEVGPFRKNRSDGHHATIDCSSDAPIEVTKRLIWNPELRSGVLKATARRSVRRRVLCRGGRSLVGKVQIAWQSTADWALARQGFLQSGTSYRAG
jgi:hypothetical protein